MKFLSLAAIVGCVVFASCEKNTMSKIPQISLKHAGPDSMYANVDTAYIVFGFADGDADLGNDANTSAVYVKDKRFDSAGFIKYDFPDIDPNIEDPKKGITGTGYVILMSPPVVPRSDTLHMTFGDTTSFEMYITDRAGNESNHITTNQIIVRP